MKLVGRNDPCSCGSGLKFKKCCWNKSAAAVKLYTVGDRDGALAKCMRFAGRPEFDEKRKAAVEIFWGDRLLDEEHEIPDEIINSEQANIAYHSWFAFDFDLGGGRTIQDLFLEREDGKLSDGERRYLEGMRGSHLRPYEILEVKADHGFELRDLWDDRRLYVRERSATRQLVAWDVVIGRIGPSGDGETVFETLPYVFPAAEKDDLLQGIRKAHRIFTEEFGGGDIAEFFKSMAPVFHHWWLESVALRSPPRIMTGDGEPFVFAKAIFDLLDRSAAAASLADSEDFAEQSDGSYVWLEPAGRVQRSIGAIVIEEKRVVFETTSKKRAEKARDELPGLLGDSIRFRAVSYEGVGQALKRAPSPAKKGKAPEIPPEIQAEVLGRFYEDHFRKWMDEPVPALGDRTPRHAARLKSVRPRLIALLKDFESHSERQRRSGTIAYDFGWMWKELGLNRE